MCAGVQAQTAQPLAKQLTMIVAGTAGGGIDLYARMLARHLERNTPGTPPVVVQDMPGAGGIRAASYFAQKAPSDGSTLAMFPGGPLIEPLISGRDLGYDMSRFRWLGAISRDVSVCVSWGASVFKTLDDAKSQEMVLAGTGAASDTDIFPLVLNSLLKTRFKVVTGYLGSRESLLAIENGEVHGRCGLTYSSLKVARPDWIRDRKLNILLQMGFAKSPDLPDVPLVTDLVQMDADRRLLEILFTSTAIGRPLAAPPQTSAAVVEALGHAFDATVRDAEFLEEGRKVQAEISPTSGAEVQRIVERMYATPRPIIERLQQMISR